MITPTTRALIKGYIDGFIQALIDGHRPTSLSPFDFRPLSVHSPEGENKPFHQALLPDGILRISEFERSFSTRLGSTFEEAAKLIAADNFAEAQRGYRLRGSVSPLAIQTIEQMTGEIDRSGMHQNYLELVQHVASVYTGEATQLRRPIVVDLYVKTHDDRELFFEMKSPKPNKDQCVGTTGKMLRIHAIRQNTPPQISTYYGMAYNPFGDTRSDYRHSFATRYLDMKRFVLIGDEFWNLLGGPGTYQDLLTIYREIGLDRSDDIIETFMR